MTTRNRHVLLALVTMCSAAACADVFGFKDLVLGDASVDAGEDADSGNACTKRAVNDAIGIFVTINGADTSTCGSRTEPCMTIQAGVNQAKLLKRSTVYIARGTYNESVDLSSTAIALEGGWDTVSETWVPICDTSQVTAVKITMPSSKNVVIDATSALACELDYLSIIGKTAPQPGETVYGVFAPNASLTLTSVGITMGAGGDGAQGTAGDAGAKGGTDCDASDGAAGTSPGHAGAGAIEGTFGPTGYTPSSGGPGAADGSAGTPGDCTISSSCITTCYTCLAVCTDKLAGCGGSAGLGGGGGSGGGSSVAIFGWDSKIVLTGGSFTAGNGGNGGSGGQGGPGGGGGSGDVKNATCMSQCTDAGCATVGNQSPQIGGGGGQGASGGQGGGGAGGSSYILFNGGDAGTVVIAQSPTLFVADAGQGGTVSGAPGKSGVQGP